eukprot:9962758-Alexandrium_andersonii.AAC.1
MVLAARQQRMAKAPLPALANGGPTVKQAHGFFVDATLPVPAQVLLRLDATGARVGEYTCAAEGVLDGLPPRDGDSEDHFVPFFGFG